MNIPKRSLEGIVILSILAIAGVLVYPLLRSTSDKMSQREVTIAKLCRIEAHALDFLQAKKTWPAPAEWERELDAHFRQDKVYLPSNLVVDGWGNKMKHIVDTDGSFRLYSFGPNRIDDYGTNDDLCVSFYSFPESHVSMESWGKRLKFIISTNGSMTTELGRSSSAKEMPVN